MNTFVGLFIRGNVVDIPGGSRFWETNVRYVNTEVFSSAYCDVSYSTKIHNWLIGLLFDCNGIAGSARWTLANVIYSNNSEQVFFSKS